MGFDCINSCSLHLYLFSKVVQRDKEDLTEAISHGTHGEKK